MNIIYKTTNLVNGKIYVGKHSTNNLNDDYLGSGIYLKNAILKYGKENFIRETLEIVEDRLKTNEREIYWIFNLNSTDKKIGYNIFYGGNGWNSEMAREIGNRIEVKNKKSKLQKEKWKDPIYRQERLKLMSGHKLSEKTKQNQSISKKEKWKNEEFRKRQLESMRSEVRRNKISESLKIAKRKYVYWLKSPDGELFSTCDLKGFCDENKLDLSAIHRVLRGRFSQHKGWVCFKREPLRGFSK